MAPIPQSGAGGALGPGISRAPPVGGVHCRGKSGRATLRPTRLSDAWRLPRRSRRHALSQLRRAHSRIADVENSGAASGCFFGPPWGPPVLAAHCLSCAAPSRARPSNTRGCAVVYAPPTPQHNTGPRQPSARAAWACDCSCDHGKRLWADHNGGCRCGRRLRNVPPAATNATVPCLRGASTPDSSPRVLAASASAVALQMLACMGACMATRPRACMHVCALRSCDCVRMGRGGGGGGPTGLSVGATTRCETTAHPCERVAIGWPRVLEGSLELEAMRGTVIAH